MLDLILSRPLIPLMLAGFAVGVPMIWIRRKNFGLYKFWQVFLLSAVCSVAGFIGMKLLGVVETAFGGGSGVVRIYGVFFFESLFVFGVTSLLHIRKDYFFDALAIASIPSFFFGRIGCLASGCCGGKHIFNSQLFWPTRESELVFCIVVFILLLRMEKKNTCPGLLFPMLMISYGCFRFVNEWFRTGKEILFGMHIAHIWSIVSIVVGASIYYELKLKAEKVTHGGTHRRAKK